MEYTTERTKAFSLIISGCGAKTGLEAQTEALVNLFLLPTDLGRVGAACPAPNFSHQELPREDAQNRS